MAASKMLTCESLIPGATVVTLSGTKPKTALIGIPPCLKIFLQRHAPIPTTFVLPSEFYQRGVVQVSLEFFVYHFLFVQGWAFREVPKSDRLVVIGTASQLKRVQAILEVTLLGFSPEDMRGWTRTIGAMQRRELDSATVAMLGKYRSWFAPKRPDFNVLQAFAQRVSSLSDHLPTIGAAANQLGVTAEAEPILVSFLQAHATGQPDDLLDLVYAFGIRALDDIIEWRELDESRGWEANCFGPRDGVRVRLGDQAHHHIVEGAGEVYEVSSLAQCDQAPYLLATSPQAACAEPSKLGVVCLGSDSGFAPVHPTTGFALSVNGQWAIVDAPVAASYLLTQHGIDPASVRLVIETHGHEDHMGSAIHFLLESLTLGRPFTYVATEPVYRTCVRKIAAICDQSDADAEGMLMRVASDEATRSSFGGGVVRVKPGVPVRLLGATWRFAWTVHPIPTAGFRVEVEDGPRTRALAFSSDTAPLYGSMGTDAMEREGFFNPANEPFTQLVHGDEDLVLWEAGGSNGDPIHFHAKEWTELCARSALKVEQPVTFMHVHPLPPELRRFSLARPGWSRILVPSPKVAATDAVCVSEALRALELRRPAYWASVLLHQGEVIQVPPGTIVVAEGEPGDAWYIVLRGSAEVRIGGKPIGTPLTPRAFFGELSILREQPRNATVAAGDGPLTCLRVPANAFRDFVVANELWPVFERFWPDIGALRRTRLFVGFAHDVVAALAKRAKRSMYEPGSILVKQGDTGDALFIIESGTVIITRVDELGNEILRTTRGAGEVIGEYGVLVPGGRRTATVSAEDRVRTLELTRDDINRVVDGQVPLTFRLVSLAAEHEIADENVQAVLRRT
jgi:CRP-like cAMP-binding protein